MGYWHPDLSKIFSLFYGCNMICMLHNTCNMACVSHVWLHGQVTFESICMPKPVRLVVAYLVAACQSICNSHDDMGHVAHLRSGSLWCGFQWWIKSIHHMKLAQTMALNWSLLTPRNPIVILCPKCCGPLASTSPQWSFQGWVSLGASNIMSMLFMTIIQ